MATMTEQAEAVQTTPETVEGTPASNNPASTTEGQETAITKPSTAVNAFKRMSADDLAALQDGFRVKLSEGKVALGHDASSNVTQPKTDTLPVEETPTETAPETTEATEPAATTEKKDPTPVVDPEVDPEVEPEPTTAGRPPQRRVRGDNPVEDMALSIKQTAARNGRPMSLTQAEAEAKRILGVTDAPETTQAPAKGIDALQAELAELRAKRKEAKAAFDTDAEDSAQSAIEDKLLEIQRTEREQIMLEQQQRAQVGQIEQSARTEAVRLYPDLKNDGKEGRPESEMHKAAKAIHAQLVESGDPAVHEPDYLLDLARRAAKVTSTPPATVAKAAAPKTVSRPSVTSPAQLPAPLTSGSARTSQPSQANNLVAGIKKASPRQLEALQDNLRAVIEKRR